MIQLSIKAGLYLTMCVALAIAWRPFEEFIPCFVYSVIIGAFASLFFYQENRAKRYACLGTATFLVVSLLFHWFLVWFDYVVLKKPEHIVFEDGILFEIVAPIVFTFIYGIPICGSLSLAANLLVSRLITGIMKLIMAKDNALLDSAERARLG